MEILGPWRSAIAICSSVNLVFRIGLPLPRFLRVVSAPKLAPSYVSHPGPGNGVGAPVEGREGRASSGTRATA